MDNSKAVEWIRAISATQSDSTNKNSLSERKEALHMAIEGLEKQIPKKIVFNSEDDREYEDYICPNCKDILQQRRKVATAITIYKFKFCQNCGQAIDWSES